MRGIPKDYKFTPKQIPGAPSIKFYSLTRARVEVNSGLFRAIEHGVSGNLISVELTHSEFTVKTRKMSYEFATIVKYDGDSSIERKVDGIYVNGELVTNGDILSTPQNKISFSGIGRIEPIVEIFQVTYTEPTGGDSGSAGGVNYATLKEQVNNASKLIHIPDGVTGDVRKTDPDPAEIRPFGRVFLAGGCGLPPTPFDAATGPLRALVGVSFIEDDLGVFAPRLTLYEWVGESGENGEWKTY